MVSWRFEKKKKKHTHTHTNTALSKQWNSTPDKTAELGVYGIIKTTERYTPGICATAASKTMELYIRCSSDSKTAENHL